MEYSYEAHARRLIRYGLGRESAQGDAHLDLHNVNTKRGDLDAESFEDEYENELKEILPKMQRSRGHPVGGGLHA